MKKLMLKLLYVLAVAVLVASCSSSRRLERAPMIGGLTGRAYMEKVIELSPDWERVSGKVSLDLDMGGKGSAKVNATLRLKRGEVIQLSVTPLLGIEVVRLELSPEGLLAVDRLNKRYVRVPFGEISRLIETDLNFDMLQSLFLNELFLPGKARLGVEDAKAFRVSLEGGKALLDAEVSKHFSYRFRTSVDQGLLQESRIGVRKTPHALRWQYSGFSRLDGRLFPSHMSLSVEGPSRPFSLDMKFSRLSTGGKWDTRTELSSRYRQVSLEELLSALLK